MSEVSDKFSSLLGGRPEAIIEDGLSGIQWNRRSGRWILLHEETGDLAASANFESATLDLAHWDVVVVEFELDGATTDVDIGIRFRNALDGANLDGLNVRDYDTAAILDLAAVFAEATLNIGGTTQFHWYILDALIPKWKIRIYVENADAVNAASYVVRVYGVRLWK